MTEDAPPAGAGPADDHAGSGNPGRAPVPHATAGKRDWLWLLLLLPYFGAVILLRDHADLIFDELRYSTFARNLTQGFYADRSFPYIPSGPGYPLVLMPFAALDAPYLAWRMPNAFFLTGAMMYFHATLRMYIPRRPALVLALAFGFYPPFLSEVHTIMAEPLATFLVCALTYHVCRWHEPGARALPHGALCGVFLGWLALTRVIFGAVLMVTLPLCILIWLVTRHRAFRRAAGVAGLGLALCTPYLAYTHNLTGEWLYWSSAGGEGLYWMASPYAGEYGEWLPADFRGIERVAANHQAFFDTIDGLSHVDREKALRRKAIANIRAHPVKYVHNWTANVGRMLFNYPISYVAQRRNTYFWMLPNMFVYTLAALCVYPTWRTRQRLPEPLALLLCFWLLSFSIISLPNAKEPFLRILIPIIVLWVAYTAYRILHIELRADDGPRSSTPAMTP